MKAATRWYRGTYEAGDPTYRFTDPEGAKVMFLAGCVAVEPATPPARWFIQQRTAVLAAAREQEARADFLWTELARHYPGERE